MDESERSFGYFLELSTQIRFSSTGVLIGLDYTAVKSFLDLKEPLNPVKRLLFDDIRLCERAFIDKYNSCNKMDVKKHG